MNSALFLHQFFEQSVKKDPLHIALICGDAMLTYEDLEQYANQWANFLVQVGVKPGSKVGLLLERTVDLYAAMLGILKAGAAYVPIDPDFPPDRINFMLADCNAELLITQKDLFDGYETVSCVTYYVEDCRARVHSAPNTKVPFSLSELSPDHFCYVIYTSGSTGQPKGVGITHLNICNYVTSALSVYGVEASDRIYQGFSLAFDASLEEIWLAFSSSATLVVGVSKSLHSGADLLEFLNQQDITVFSCVPTLLALLKNDIPSLRILILGGEVCSTHLISRWHRQGLTIWNTYGPTEATVVSTYTECHPDKPVTIGKPLPNYEVYILNDQMQITAPGEEGEIYIGGVGVAKGYLNRSELTSQRFIDNPFKSTHEKLYRTGDLGTVSEDGNIQYLGRQDGQIKLRGFRIELAEIEARIREYPGIQNAAITLHELIPGVKTLVGYVILEKNAMVDFIKLSEKLHDCLPEYMVPSLFETVTEFPLLVSGKVNRSQLPKPTSHHDSINQKYVAPRTKLEKKIALCWEEIFGHSPISTTANFFHDLGGHSLAAASMISRLRQYPEMRYLSVLDVYEHQTIQQLANKVAETQQEQKDDPFRFIEEKSTAKKKQRDLHYYLCAMGQLISAYIPAALSSWQFLLFFLLLKPVANANSLFSSQFLFTLMMILLLLPPATFVISIISKWLLLGKIKPGNYKLWGGYYFRWWLAQKIQAIAPIEFLVGSPLINIYYRLLGAKIGKDCYIGTDSVDSYDLLTIGDGSSVGAETDLSGYMIENGWLRIGKINIGKHCYIGNNSVLSINTTLEDNTALDDQSMLPENKTIYKNQQYLGSPARLGKVNVPKAPSLAPVSLFKKISLGILYYFSLCFVLFVFTCALIPGIALIDYFYFQDQFLECFMLVPVGGLIFIVLLSISVVISKKIILNKIAPGQYSLNSTFYIRKWLVDCLLNLSQSALGTLYATIFLPFWFRLLGAKIGKRTEISTATHITPELLEIKDECFIADGVFLGAQRVHDGYVTLAKNVIGKRTFVGNSALLPVGTALGDNCLIACLSVPPTNEEAGKSNTAWFGSPAVFLPKREVFEGFSEKETYAPNLALYFKRSVVDFFRVLLPPLFLFLELAMQFLGAGFLNEHFALLTVFLLFPFVDLGIALAIGSVVIALKWILMGKYRTSVQPAWSWFVWINELVTGLYDNVLSPYLLEPLSGTPFICFFLRLLGMKIGKRVYIDTTFFTEFDLIQIGNDVSLNGGSTIQTHLFEDRVMKMAKIKIEDNCTVGNGAVVLYNTLMEKHASLASLSLLMKGERLPAYSYWQGIPAQHFPLSPSHIPNVTPVLANDYEENLVPDPDQ